MASVAHCAYCFECLTASLEGRKPLALDQISHSWEQYQDSANSKDPNANSTKIVSHNGALPSSITRLVAHSPATNSSSSVQSSNSSTPSDSTQSSSASSKSSSSTSIRASLARKLGGDKRNYANATTDGAGDEVAYPLFVTWNITGRSGHKNLRGCIGTFEAQELEDGLRSYALTSAFEDVRFRPISSREVPALECGVTLLTNFEPIADPMDWEIGTHGLRISFTWLGRRYGSTYLPDVAREQGWTKDETIVSLMRKAGWEGDKSDWRSIKTLQVIRYQGKKSSLDYAEWRQWRTWAAETGSC